MFILNLIKTIPKGIKKVKILNNNDIFVTLKNKNDLKKYVLFLKNNINYKFKILNYLTCVDNLNNNNKNNKERYCLYYFFLSIDYKYKICLKIHLSELERYISSLCKYYNSANWLEREVWDMFGVFFNNHLDIRNILNDYGFDGFPLRKDFPLTGYLEVFYNNECKYVNYKSLEMTQTLRNYTFNNPWENKSEDEYDKFYNNINNIINIKSFKI